MKLKLLILISMSVADLIAQSDSSQPGAKQITRVVRVRGDAFGISNLLGKSGTVEHQATNAIRAIVLKGPAQDVDSMEHTIQELDKLSSTSGSEDVELTAVVIEGAMDSTAAAQEPSSEALGSVIKQLRSIFPYKSYQVLSTTLLRTTQGNAVHRSRGSLKWQSRKSDEERAALGYDLVFGLVELSTDRSIHLGEVQFNTMVPLKAVVVSKENSGPPSPPMQMVEIRTNVDLREGQQIVVGSATVADADVCLFLVVSAKVVQ